MLVATLALLASLVPPLLFGGTQPADAQPELSFSDNHDALSIDPAVIEPATIGEEVTLTLDPGPWPDAVQDVELDVMQLFGDFETVDGVFSLRTAGGMGPVNEAVAVFTQNLPEGRYEVSARGRNDGFGWNWLGNAEFLVSQTGGAYTVNGVVQDSTGAGVEGMCVSVNTPDFVDSASGLTDSGGRYSVTLLSSSDGAGGLPVILNVSDCSDRAWPSEVYVAAEGESRITDVSLRQDTPHEQDWTVYRAAVVDVEVRDEAGSVLDCARTLGPLGPGEHTLLVPNCFDSGTSYADVWVGNTRNPEEAEVITVAEGQRLSRTVTVQPAGFVTGRITEAATGLAASSCVQVFERVDGVRTFASQRISPSATMEYTLRVGPGEPVLEFNQCERTNFATGGVDLQPFPYQQQFYDRAASLEDADAVAVSPGATVPGIDAALLAEGEEAPDEPETFSDVPAGHPFATEIGWAVEEGVTTGFPDGTFRPTVAVSRQAAAAFLYRLAGEPEVTAEAGFSDVPQGHPFETEIAWLVQEGITTGFPDGTFRPTQAVSRQAAAAFLYRYDGEPAVGSDAGFPDVPAGHPFESEIAWLVGEGITTGFPDDTFRPVNDVTRQAMAAFLYRYETD